MTLDVPLEIPSDIPEAITTIDIHPLPSEINDDQDAIPNDTVPSHKLTTEKPTADKPRETAASDAIAGLSLPARMEAVLYLKGRPLTLKELSEIAAISREEAEIALITLMADYAHRDTALEVRQEGQRYSLQLRDGLGDLVQNLLPVDLSTAALRTLATIALKKRILQSDLVDLRGSGAYDHIKELIAQNFIERKRQSEGRSYWLTLSEKFHRTFAIKTDEIQPLRKSIPGADGPEASLASPQSAPPGSAPAGSAPTSEDWKQAA
jgi:segregation and condensation protein B